MVYVPTQKARVCYHQPGICTYQIGDSSGQPIVAHDDDDDFSITYQLYYFIIYTLTHEILGDDLILKLGQFLTEKYGYNKPEEARKIMRLKNECFSNLILPEHIDVLMEATKKLRKMSVTEIGSKNAPSASKRIGLAIRKCMLAAEKIFLRLHLSVG